MANEIKVIKVEPSVRDYVEGLDYEYSTRRDLVAFMISNNMDTTTDSFEKYQKEMGEYSVKFKLAKQEIEDQYVKPIIGDKKVRWVLNYRDCELTITFLD